eukprot:615780-Amphidinium_carterae.1
MRRACPARTSCRGKVRQTLPSGGCPSLPASPIDVTGASNVLRRWRTSVVTRYLPWKREMRAVSTATGATRRWTSIVASCAAPTMCAGTMPLCQLALRVWKSSSVRCMDASRRALGRGTRLGVGTTQAPCACPPTEGSRRGCAPPVQTSAQRVPGVTSQ